MTKNIERIIKRIQFGLSTKYNNLTICLVLDDFFFEIYKLKNFVTKLTLEYEF